MKMWGLGAFGLAAVAGIVVLGAGVLGGVAQAQEPTEDGPGWRELYQEALAGQLGVSVDELQAAQEAAKTQAIDDALASGLITDAQAERLRNAEPGDLRRGFGKRARHAIGNAFESVAEILGLTTEEVRQGLVDGKTLNDLAAEQGVTDLEAQLVAKLTADIQAKFDDNSITQEQADMMLENLTERVSNLVNHEGKFGGRFGGHRGFGPGPAGEAPSEN
jgi:hypothetical protein